MANKLTYKKFRRFCDFTLDFSPQLFLAIQLNFDIGKQFIPIFLRTYKHILYVVWCRRTDELVDGPNASHITPSALDRWESRLEDLFAGCPYDMLDAALSDTVTKFPVDIQACFYCYIPWIKLHQFQKSIAQHANLHHYYITLLLDLPLLVSFHIKLFFCFLFLVAL